MLVGHDGQMHASNLRHYFVSSEQQFEASKLGNVAVPVDGDPALRRDVRGVRHLPHPVPRVVRAGQLATRHGIGRAEHTCLAALVLDDGLGHPRGADGQPEAADPDAFGDHDLGGGIPCREVLRVRAQVRDRDLSRRQLRA